MAAARVNRVETVFVWGSILETVFLALAISLTVLPGTRGEGAFLLAVFAIPAGFLFYGGYLSYVRDSILIGNELSQGVKWTVLGFIIGGLLITVFSLPTWLIFVIPPAFAGLMVGYRIVTRDEPARSLRDGLSRLEFVLALVVVAAYFGWTFLYGTWTSLDTIAVFVVAFFSVINWRRYWQSESS